MFGPQPPESESTPILGLPFLIHLSIDLPHRLPFSVHFTLRPNHPHPSATTVTGRLVDEMQETVTQKWLKENTQYYPHRDTVYNHTDAVLTRYPTLRPKTDVYTFDDGRSQLLLCLHGLLPITYRGAPYNIPIALWFTKDYPRLPPISYVVPTSDMLVRAGKYIDVSGKCEIEYVRNWQRKSEGCTLIALLEAMQEHFSHEPPVYAKPKHTPLPQPQPRRPESATNYSERPPPPLPPISPPVNQPALPSSSHNDDRPALPSKPGVVTIPRPTASVPVSPQISGRSQSPLVPSPSARSPLPLPPHPHPDSGLPQYRSSPVPPRYHPNTYLPSSSIGRVSNSPVWSPGSAAQLTTAQRVASTPAIPPHASSLSQTSFSSIQSSPAALPEQETVSPHLSGPARPPPPVPAPIRAIPSSHSAQPQPQYPSTIVPPAFVSPQPSRSTRTPYQSPPPPPPLPPPPHAPPRAEYTSPVSLPQTPPSHPPPDLLDGDNLNSLTSADPVQALSSAPAPPRPPNPELLQLHSKVHDKITSELASLSQAMALDAERLRAHQRDLLAGEPAIRDEMARLEAVRDVCRNVSGRLNVVVADGERNVAELKRKGDPDVDELVCSTTIVHNQLINLVAEDNAIEDTIYHLHRALNAGRIDLERFLRSTRALAEEQFMKRALIEKILNGIPMGESVDWR